MYFRLFSAVFGDTTASKSYQPFLLASTQRLNLYFENELSGKYFSSTLLYILL